MTTQSIEGAMPPLPEPDHKFVDMEDEDPDILVWRAEKMHAYAKAYAAPMLARVAELEALLFKARAGLANGLWDYGPGQDEHAQCNALIKEIDAALAAHKEQP